MRHLRGGHGVDLGFRRGEKERVEWKAEVAGGAGARFGGVAIGSVAGFGVAGEERMDLGDRGEGGVSE